MKEMIKAKDISFRYLEEKDFSLKNINFTINKGEVILLAGNSGCGKSTLLNIINGIITEVIEGQLQGDLYIKGEKNLKFDKRSFIISNVFQNPRSQFFTSDTTSELVFAMENFSKSYEYMKDRLSFIKEKYKIKNLLNRDIFTLSSGERQLIALLTSVITDPSVLIFDEPCANLDYGNAMRLKRQIEDLKKSKKTIIISEHRYFYLKDVIDKVFLIENKTLKEFTKDEFLNYSYGKRVFDLFKFPYKKRKIFKSNVESVKIKNLFFKNILENVNLTLNKNEVSVIVGVNGAGKSTLSRIIQGLEKNYKGEVKLKQKSLYIMQDPDFQLFCENCLKELYITSKDIEKNEKALKMVCLENFSKKHPQSLSMGQKQRLQMAISYVSNNEVVILDEPTSGLCKKTMEKIIDLIEILKKDKCVIIVSHDYEFIRKVADRVIYLKNKNVDKDFYLYDENIEILNNIYREMEDYYE